MRLSYWIFGIISITVVSAATTTAFLYRGNEATKTLTALVDKEYKAKPRHTSTLMSTDYFDDIYNQAAYVPEILPQTRGITLPHHLVAAPFIASVVEQFSKQDITRVIVIGPDHLRRARVGAVTSDYDWNTAYGILSADTEAVARLLDASVVTRDDSTLDAEHSIAALVSFFKKSLPDARIVPILVNDRLKDSVADELARALPMDSHTLVVASVDFSHYLPRSVADFHDETSMAALGRFAYDDLPQLEIDSPQSLRVFLKAMEQEKAQHMQLLAHSNSASNDEVLETTSHVLAGFSSGLVFQDKPVTILAMGDMMFDRNVRKHMEKSGNEYVYEKIRGAEDRFFRGIDIVTGNLEGAISARRAPVKEIDFAFDEHIASLLKKFHYTVVNLANNHAFDQGKQGYEDTKKALDAVGIGYVGSQIRDDVKPWETVIRGKRVAMLGFNITDKTLDEAAASKAIKDAKATHDVVLVQIHWGAEYKNRPTETQRVIGRKLVDWGADAVIGTHPHVVQGMEIWNNKPIFWSLGNFSFDQYFSKETQQGLMVGFVIGTDQTKIFLYPMQSVNSQPLLAVGATRNQILKDFLEVSDLSNHSKEYMQTGGILTILNN